MSTEPEIRELLPPETGLAFEAMRELRTDLSDERRLSAKSMRSSARRAIDS